MRVVIDTNLWLSGLMLPTSEPGLRVRAVVAGEMVAVNARTGEFERSVDLGESVTVGPIALGDSVYFVTDEARLIAVR